MTERVKVDVLHLRKLQSEPLVAPALLGDDDVDGEDDSPFPLVYVGLDVLCD